MDRILYAAEIPKFTDPVGASQSFNQQHIPSIRYKIHRNGENILGNLLESFAICQELNLVPGGSWLIVLLPRISAHGNCCIKFTTDNIFMNRFGIWELSWDGLPHFPGVALSKVTGTLISGWCEDCHNTFKNMLELLLNLYGSTVFVYFYRDRINRGNLSPPIRWCY